MWTHLPAGVGNLATSLADYSDRVSNPISTLPNTAVKLNACVPSNGRTRHEPLMLITSRMVIRVYQEQQKVCRREGMRMRMGLRYQKEEKGKGSPKS